MAMAIYFEQLDTSMASQIINNLLNYKKLHIKYWGTKSLHLNIHLIHNLISNLHISTDYHNIYYTLFFTINEQVFTLHL